MPWMCLRDGKFGEALFKAALSVLLNYGVLIEKLG